MRPEVAEFLQREREFDAWRVSHRAELRNPGDFPGVSVEYGQLRSELTARRAELTSLALARRKDLQTRRREISMPESIKGIYRDSFDPKALQLKHFEITGNGEDEYGFPADYIFGPRYHIRTRRGQELDVMTTVLDHETGKDDHELDHHFHSYRQVHMLALDRKGLPLASQRIQFTYSLEEYRRRKAEYESREGFSLGASDPRGASVYSEVYTALRNGGLAIPMQIVALDFLQREANRIGHPVFYSIQNANEILHKPGLPEIQRWHAVWGHNGWLSRDPRYVPNRNYKEERSHANDKDAVTAWMTIAPVKSAETPAGEIYLSRSMELYNGGPLYNVDSVKIARSFNGFQTMQRARLRRLVGSWEANGLLSNMD